MGNKSNYNLRAFYLSEISRGPVVWGRSRYPFQAEEYVGVPATPTTKK